jgi:hypothetical protein
VTVRKLTWGLLPLGLAAAALLGCGDAARAQFTGTTGSTTGFSGSSFGSTGGRTAGSGFSGSSSTGGSFSGTASRTGSGAGSNSYGSTTFLGSFYANPMAFGLPTQANLKSDLGTIGSGGSTGGLGSTGTSRTGSTSGTSGSSGLSTSKNTTAAVPFGQPLYNITNTGSRTGTTGSATIRSGTNTGLGQQISSLQTQTRPSYAARVGFQPPPVSLDTAAASFQQALQGSPELSKPENRIQLVVDGNNLILRGTVQTDRERYLAEVLASLTPGVRGVRNELEVRESETAMSPR